MKLKSLGPIAGDSSRCKLVFDDGTVIKTLTSVAAGHGLYPGIVLEGAAWQAFLDDVEAAGARLRAVRIVSAAAVSEKELRRRLVRKGESQQNADAAADWLKDIGALDDGELAGRIARRAAAKGYGRVRIRQELAQKGVPKEFWDAALDALAHVGEMQLKTATDPGELRRARNFIAWQQQRSEDGVFDPLFFHAPQLLMFVSKGNDVRDASAAAAYTELMAAELGLGCLYSGYFTACCAGSREIQAMLGLAPDEQVVRCLVLGHPDVKFRRTAPRKHVSLTEL